MALFKRGQFWWYKFYFAGQEIRESSKSNSKTVAKNAEQQRRKELEAGWGVTGVSLMVISGLGRMAEGFITQAQGIQ